MAGSRSRVVLTVELEQRASDLPQVRSSTALHALPLGALQRLLVEEPLLEDRAPRLAIEGAVREDVTGARWAFRRSGHDEVRASAVPRARRPSYFAPLPPARDERPSPYAFSRL